MRARSDHDTEDLASLEVAIEELEAALVSAHRAAGDLFGDEAASELVNVEAMTIKLRLDHCYRRYFKVSQNLRKPQCFEHGEAFIVVCPECCATRGKAPPANVIPLSVSLGRSTAINDIAKELGVEPAKAMRIARLAFSMKRTG